MKHDFRLAGLLTYLGLLCLPTFMFIGSGWRIKVNSIREDEVHSNGTVQDSHLIPFSSVSSLVWEVSEQDFAKIGKKNEWQVGGGEFSSLTLFSSYGHIRKL